MDQYNSIKKACKINDIIFKEIVNSFDFKTENDLKLYILKRFKDFGVGSSYTPIVANNTNVIHVVPSKKKFSRGFLVLDFGSKVNGYCSDMTRTIFIGKANAKERKLYKLLKDCQWKCVKKVKEGVSCKELDAYSRKLLGKYKKFYLHSLGHGVGNHIHTKPRLSPRFDDYLEEGQFVTIEPGIYIKNKNACFGMRIEDTLLVKKKGYEIMTNSPRNFIEIK